MVENTLKNSSNSVVTVAKLKKCCQICHHNY
jgi:hypothetical protein